MATFYKLTGDYLEPYRWVCYYPESDEEITEEIYYRHHRPMEKILGIYLTEEQAKEAQKRFTTYEIVTHKTSSYKETTCPYKNVRYTVMKIGDHVKLPLLEPDSDSEEYDPIRSQDEITEEERYYNL